MKIEKAIELMERGKILICGENRYKIEDGNLYYTNLTRPEDWWLESIIDIKLIKSNWEISKEISKEIKDTDIKKGNTLHDKILSITYQQDNHIGLSNCKVIKMSDVKRFIKDVQRIIEPLKAASEYEDIANSILWDIDILTGEF